MLHVNACVCIAAEAEKQWKELLERKDIELASVKCLRDEAEVQHNSQLMKLHIDVSLLIPTLPSPPIDGQAELAACD